MLNRLSRLATAVILAMTFLSQNSCSLPSTVKPDVTIVNALFTDVNLFETGMEFTLKVTNHSPEPLSIDGTVYRIYINGIDIGTGSSGDQLDIPKFSSATQTVHLALSNLSMMSNIRALVESKHFDYKIKGEFYLKDSGLLPKKAYIEKSDRFDFADWIPPASGPNRLKGER